MFITVILTLLVVNVSAYYVILLEIQTMVLTIMWQKESLKND